MNTKLITIIGAGAMLVVMSVQAQTLTFSTTAPIPGGADQDNLTGAANAGLNVGSGAQGGDTYVALDQNAAQGEEFTTGGNAGGYTLNGFWLQHVLYTSVYTSTGPGNGTFWNVNTPGAQLTYRLTLPIASGTPGFVLDSANYTITGTEPNNFGTGGNGSSLGTGTWMYFTFGTPIILAANTQYGVDLTTATSPTLYFETAGNNANPYTGGDAYTTTRGGTAPTIYTGQDRVFDVSLSPVPEPSTFALCGLSGLAILLRRRSGAVTWK
jgi:hypothetical protein